jgi:alginate O-acetyltransferase complex protein AlgI
MAIGLGQVFGLTLPENFRQPYRAASITEFWRRWHITLSTWFRDYLYIPLGGNRRGSFRTGFNLVIVFFLCGLWHGAAWTFVLWGLYHGALLLVERGLKLRWGLATRGRPGRVLTFALVLAGWVIFRSPTVAQARDYYRAMLGLAGPANPAFSLNCFLTNNTICYLGLAALCAFWPEPGSQPGRVPTRAWGRALRPYAALVITALALIAQSPHSFNPFIYFRF